MSDVNTLTRLATVVHLMDDRFDSFNLGQMEIVINRGAEQGVKLGDRFLVFGDGPHIVDPDSGKDLGQLELVRGQGEVVHVQERLATIRTTGRRRTRPARRVIRDRSLGLVAGFGPIPSPVIEEELAPEAEVPFEAVRLGDHAKPI